MKTSLRILIFTSLLFGRTETMASGPMNVEITYKWVDTLKYDFVFTFYRDCRNTPLSNPTDIVRIRCESGGGTFGIDLTLKSISEITILCDKAGRRCNPANTAGTGEGIEAHVYTSRVDFRDSKYSSLLSCGRVIVETAYCCRNSSSYLGSGNYYNFALIDLAKVVVNNGPVFNRPVETKIVCNQPYYFNLLTTESDGDSLSYSMACAMSGFKTCHNYPSNYTPRKPLTAYWPTGLSYPYASPNNNPPIGLFFDSTNGDLVFTPTNCGETGYLAIEVKEWRKNAKGIYEHIGTVRRDALFGVWFQTNNTPVIPRREPFALFEGDSININIVPVDKPYFKGSDWSDSLKVYWLDSIPGAKYTKVDTAQMQYLKFSWTPGSGRASMVPYKLTLQAIDDECPFPANTYGQYLIYVQKKIEAKVKTTTGACPNYLVQLEMDSVHMPYLKRFEWSILDTAGTPINDQRVWFTKSQGSLGIGFLHDEVQIRRSGTYIVKVRVLHHERFWQNYYDTIVIAKNQANWFSKTSFILCSGDTMSLKPDPATTAGFKNFMWHELATDTVTEKLIRFDDLTYLGSEYRLMATDNKGLCWEDEIIGIPASVLSVTVPADTSVCEGSHFQLTGTFGNHHPLAWDTAYWNTGISGQTISPNKGGVYIFTAENECSTFADTVVVAEILKPTVSLPPDKELCSGDSIMLDASFPDADYKWSGGDTVSTIKVETPGVYSVEISTQCGMARDTFVVGNMINVPQIELGEDKVACVTETVKLDAGTGSWQYSWNTNESTREIIATQNGKYKVAVSNICGTAEDSITVRFDYLLVLELGPDIETDDPARHMLDAGNPGARYSWSTGDTGRTITTKFFGNYWVTVRNACGEVRDTIRVNKKIGIWEIESDGINIYPNPAKGTLNVEGTDLGKPVFEVFDINGKEIPVKQETIQAGMNYRISVQAAPGIYTLVWLKGETRNKKVFMIE